MYVRKKRLVAALEISLMSALTVVSSWISIPTSPPITLQLFAILLSLYLLGGRGGVVTVVLYLSIGALGLPVFSGFSGGVGYILGASGGYLFGFLFGAVIYWILEKPLSFLKHYKIILSAILIIIVYIFGTLWFALVYASGSASGIFALLSVCVLPYIIPDAAKLVLALAIYERLKIHLNINGAKNGKG